MRRARWWVGAPLAVLGMLTLAVLLGVCWIYELVTGHELWEQGT